MFDNNGDSPTPAAGAQNVINNPVPPTDPVSSPNVVSSPSINNEAPSVPSWAQPSEPAPPPVVPNLQEPELPPAPMNPQTVIASVQPPVFESPPTVQTWTPPPPPLEENKVVSESNPQEAARAVVNLYLDYRLKLALGQEPKLEVWEEATKKFPSFAQKIHDFGEALRDAEKTKKESFPEADSLIQKISFHSVCDEASRMILTDILWRRATSNTGKFDRDLNLPQEAAQMMKEMEISDEAIDDEVDISPSEIVEKILGGKLRISPHLS